MAHRALKAIPALTVILAVLPISTARSEGEAQMTSATFLAEASGSQDRIVGSFLWVWLKANAEDVTPNQAGTLIAAVPPMRAMTVAACKPGALLVPTLRDVMAPFLMLSMDSDIR